VCEKRSNHTVYKINYHFLWCLNYHHAILKSIEDSLEASFRDVYNQYGYEILSLHILPDHVHLFLSAHPKHASGEIARTIKNITAREMWEQHESFCRSICGIVGSGNGRATSERQEQSQRRRLNGISNVQNTSKCRLLGVKPRGTCLVYF
jgi:putative transposase